MDASEKVKAVKAGLHAGLANAHKPNLSGAKAREIVAGAKKALHEKKF